MKKNILFILVILCILVSNYLTLKIGNNHYQTKDCELFDIFHKILPDLYQYHYLLDFIGLFGFLSIFYILNETTMIEFFAKFVIIMFIRAFTIISTILPKHQVCNDNFDIRSYFLGGCYDKIFSGHTSFLLLLTLIYYREHFIDGFALIGLNLVNILLILSTRSHYTVDILLAVFVTTTIYNIKV